MTGASIQWRAVRYGRIDGETEHVCAQMNTDPHRKEMLTSADLGPTRMRVVIDELIKAESGPPSAVATR